MADSEEIGLNFKSRIPTLAADADITTAFKMYHYGVEVSPGPGNYAPNSIEGNLQAIDGRVDYLEAAGSGGRVSTVEPTAISLGVPSVPNGFIWVNPSIAAASVSYIADINTQVASYTLATADAGKIVEMNVGSANNLTIPTQASVPIPVGTIIRITQIGAGQTTVLADSGVTIRSRSSYIKLSGQYAKAEIYKRDTNEWLLSGDLSA